MKTKTIMIGDRPIGGDTPCFIVAEAGANHEGKFELAKELIDAARATKSDSIKFQHYTAEKLTSKEAKRYWMVHGDERGFQFDPTRYKDAQLDTFKKIDGIPRDKDRELMAYGASKNIVVFSTPFDFESVDHLESIGTPLYKIASGDLTHHEFLRYVAKKGKPVVLSTGAANLSEIRDAVHVIEDAGNDQIILLHCTLAYPTPLDHANLLMMLDLQKEFPNALIGLSDHTPGVEADVAAALLGAVMIEKHFTHTPGPAAGANRVGESPDHDIGIGPEIFTEMVRRIREDEAKKSSVRMGLSHEEALKRIREGKFPEVLGAYTKKQVDENVELKARAQARRSIVVNKLIPKGTVITSAMVNDDTFTVKRPGTGIAPFEMDKLEGKRFVVDVGADAVLQWSHLA